MPFGRSFRLLNHALLHRDTDNAGAGEKTFTLDSESCAELITEANAGGGRVVRNSFKVVNASADEIILAAIDRRDMQDWVRFYSNSGHCM